MVQQDLTPRVGAKVQQNYACKSNLVFYKYVLNMVVSSKYYLMNGGTDCFSTLTVGESISTLRMIYKSPGLSSLRNWM